MKLIDADELRKDIVERGTQLSGCYSAGIARYMDRMLAHVLAAFDNAPTIDAVPVVRCRDCKWKANTIGDSWCDFHEFTILSDDDFCSYGERKDNEID